MNGNEKKSIYKIDPIINLVINYAFARSAKFIIGTIVLVS